MLNADSYLFNSEQDAWDLIGYLQRQIDNYGAASVLEFKHYMGEGALNGDEDIGWRSIEGRSVYRGRFGWMIDLPEPKKL